MPQKTEPREPAITGEVDPLAELVARTAQGDVDSWGVLWAQAAPVVVRFIAGRLGKPTWDADVNDLASTTMERVRKVASSFREESQVTTWILGIARNVMLEHWNRVQKEARATAQLGGVSANPENGAGTEQVGGEAFDLTNELIDDLPPAQARAIKLDMGFSDTRMAREGLTGRELVAHRQNVSRAKRRMMSRIVTEERYALLRGFLTGSSDREGENA